MDLNIKWKFQDEMDGMYPYYKAYLNDKPIAMIVIRDDHYRLTMLWDDYAHKEFNSVWEAKNQFDVEMVTARLEGKV